MSTNEPLPQNMRKQVRVDVSEIVRVIDRQGNCDIGQLVNISDEGLMLFMSQPITESRILQLSLEFCNEAGEKVPIHIGVESLWCNKGSEETQFWAGFYIIDISEEDLGQIRSMLD
jgi:hypothetical protein